MHGRPPLFVRTDGLAYPDGTVVTRQLDSPGSPGPLRCIAWSGMLE